MVDEGDRFIDFDQYDDEIEDKSFKFKFGSEDFEIDFNAIDGTIVLRWMRRGIGPSALPALLEDLLGPDDYKRMLDTKQPWPKYEKLMLWLVTELAGSGNVLPTN